MNILLNLLPEDKKAHLKERVRSRFVFSQMLMLLFFQGFYIFILAGAFFALQYNESSFQSTTQKMESGDSRKALLEIEKKFQEVNKRVEIATMLDREHFHFTDLLLVFERALPTGITLTSMTTKDYEVSFSGKAEERNNIVLLEKKLNEESCIASVNIPSSTWLSPKDIDFQISFSIKKECIK